MSVVPENRAKANDLFKKGKTKEAMAAYEKCISDCSKDDKRELAILYNNLGMAQKKEKMVDEAIMSFTKSVTSDPTYVKPLFHRFNLNLLSGELAEAWNDGRLILQLDPNFMKGEFASSIMKDLEKTIKKKII